MKEEAKNEDNETICQEEVKYWQEIAKCFRERIKKEVKDWNNKESKNTQKKRLKVAP